jgi:hypothetical protein
VAHRHAVDSTVSLPGVLLFAADGFSPLLRHLLEFTLTGQSTNGYIRVQQQLRNGIVCAESTYREGAVAVVDQRAWCEADSLALGAVFHAVVGLLDFDKSAEAFTCSKYVPLLMCCAHRSWTHQVWYVSKPAHLRRNQHGF